MAFRRSRPSWTTATEPLTLIWLGREVIEGIETGRALTVHGRVGRRGEERVLYNPRYELDA